jgi:hypothetical protein
MHSRPWSALAAFVGLSLALFHRRVNDSLAVGREGEAEDFHSNRTRLATGGSRARTLVPQRGRPAGAVPVPAGCDIPQTFAESSVAAALAFLGEVGVEVLTVAGLEHHGGTPLAFAECSVLLPEQGGEVIRRCCARSELLGLLARARGA